MPDIIRQTSKIQNFIFPNDKVTNSIFSNSNVEKLNRHEFLIKAFNDGVELSTVSRYKRTGLVTIKFYSENFHELTYFDGIIYSAICSLICDPDISNNDYLTINMICNAIKQCSGKPPKGFENRIKDGLSKMAKIKIDIDYSKEMQFFDGLKLDNNYNISGYLLNVEKSTDIVSLNGVIVDECYHFLEPPILFKYAQMKNQIATISLDKIKTSVLKSLDTVLLNNLLIKRIYAMKGRNRKLQKTITLESIYTTVFTETGLTDIDSKKEENQKGKIRKKTEKVLQDFVKNDFIKGFKIIKKGRKIHSYCIEI